MFSSWLRFSRGWLVKTVHFLNDSLILVNKSIDHFSLYTSQGKIEFLVGCDSLSGKGLVYLNFCYYVNMDYGKVLK